MKAYDDLSSRGQARRLKTVAENLASQFDLVKPRLHLLHHGFNTTFEVTDANGHFALRVNTNSVSKTEALAAEIAWIRAIATDTDISVPHPQATKEGCYTATAFSEDFGRNVVGVLYSWLPGHNLDKCPNTMAYEQLGQLMAELHRHGRDFTLPEGASLRLVGDILDHRDLLIVGRPEVEDLGVFEAVQAEANAVFAKMRTQPDFPIHCDLHAANLKWNKRRLSVFDFDDCARGWPFLDAAISMFYLRRYPDAANLESAFWRGFGSSVEAMGFTNREFEALVAGRGLMLMNELQVMNTADLAAIRGPYITVTEKRLRHFLDTGTFDPNVASM